MKSTIALLLLLLLAVLLPAAVPAVIAATVKDISGGDLQRGVEYHVIFSSRGGDRVLATAVRHKSCPPTVAEGPGDAVALPGLAIKFSPTGLGADLVNVSENVYIEFSPTTELMRALLSLCGTKFSMWKVSDTDVTTGKQYVTAGGTPPSTPRFRIEAYSQEGTYKIVYCLDSCKDHCDAACAKNVGIIIEDGKVWLGLTDDATPFQFRKAQKANS